jgi:hypothetical protein
VTQTERALRALIDDVAGEGAGHLARAVAATALADLATRIAREEVMSARDEGSTWSAVGDAFGITTQTAHERFRSGPHGLHSRFDRSR